MTAGIVFSIGVFAVHDRPGIFTMPCMFPIRGVFPWAVRAGGQCRAHGPLGAGAAAVVLPCLLAIGGTCVFGFFALGALDNFFAKISGIKYKSLGQIQ